MIRSTIISATLLIAASCAPQAFAQSSGSTVTCSSEDGGRHYCTADTRGGVRLLRQRSGSSCEEGRSWGYDGRGIWVDRGCRADFSVNTYNGAGNGRDRDWHDRDWRDRQDARDRNPDWRDRDRGTGSGSGQQVTCSSEDGGRHYCSADTSGGVRMLRQRSGSSCDEGRTWGYDRRGIWVDKGCRADFATGRY